MFIRKWRYEMQLQMAREEGKREGYRDAVEKYHEMLLDLEKENLKLRENIASGCKDIENLNNIIRNLRIEAAENFKRLVNVLATELAEAQRLADVEYYIHNDIEKSEIYCCAAELTKVRACKLGICPEVYERAYEIYDFRNSGKEGYTLVDGKIVPVEEAPVQQEESVGNEQDAPQGDPCEQEEITTDGAAEPTDPDEYLIREACTAEEQEATCQEEAQEEIACPFEECPY